MAAPEAEIDAPVRFRHVGLTVDDLEASLRFWRDGLGLELVFTQEMRGGYMDAITLQDGVEVRQAHLRFPGSSAWVELLEYVSPPGREIVARPRDRGTGHLAVTCADLAETLARLCRHGGEPFGEPVRIDRGANRGALVVYLRDPDQHIVELVQPAGEGAPRPGD